MANVKVFINHLLSLGKLSWADDKKRMNVVVCIGLVGLLLLAASEWFVAPETKEVASISEEQLHTDYAQQLENKLEELISQVEGVGRAKVMVTLENGEKNVYAIDSEQTGEETLSANHVLSGDGGLLETVETPKVLGVAVVCEGGNMAAVQNRVIALVDALTDVGTNHITVTQMALNE